jgi:CTP synthase
LQEPVNIVLIGKYTVLSDAYLSVLKALQHACMAAGLKLQLTWVEAQYLEPEAQEEKPEKYAESWKQVGAPAVQLAPAGPGDAVELCVWELPLVCCFLSCERL